MSEKETTLPVMGETLARIETLVQANASTTEAPEKVTVRSERRPYSNCPCCNYSAPPWERRAEYKHFDPHWLECDRCHWQTQTYPNFIHARWAWNYARAIELAVQRAEMAEHFPSRSGLGEKVNFSNEPVSDAVRLKQPSLSNPSDSKRED